MITLLGLLRSSWSCIFTLLNTEQSKLHSTATNLTDSNHICQRKECPHLPCWWHCSLATNLNTKVQEIPLLEGSSVHLNKGTLNKCFCSIVGSIVDHIQDSGLVGNCFNARHLILPLRILILLTLLLLESFVLACLPISYLHKHIYNKMKQRWHQNCEKQQTSHYQRNKCFCSDLGSIVEHIQGSGLASNCFTSPGVVTILSLHKRLPLRTLNVLLLDNFVLAGCLPMSYLHKHIYTNFTRPENKSKMIQRHQN